MDMDNTQPGADYVYENLADSEKEGIETWLNFFDDKY
jgi:hypothetical protein